MAAEDVRGPSAAHAGIQTPVMRAKSLHLCTIESLIHPFANLETISDRSYIHHTEGYGTTGKNSTC